MKLKEDIALQLGVNSKSIKNIIFDLGNVLIDINLQNTIDAFTKLGLEDLKKSFSYEHQDPMFLDFELGTVNAENFRKHIKNYVKKNVSDQQIDDAWNSMLMDFPLERITLLKKLKNDYRLFILSNTNEIHLHAFTSSAEQVHGKGIFESLFEKTYYSNLIHLRKPNQEIYDYVIQDAAIDPAQTLFIDDLEKNIEGARMTGLKAYHLVDLKITDIFKQD